MNKLEHGCTYDEALIFAKTGKKIFISKILFYHS